MWLPVDHPATSPVSRLSYLTRKAAGDLRLRSASIHSHCRELFEFPLTPRYSHLPRSSPGLCGVAESVGARMSPRQRECQWRLPWNRASYWRPSARSEEHTSELQSLMRISYAVFCLKKQQKQSN